jgi:HPt (histidine-containing phosphotransfer) domain-containing protein
MASVPACPHNGIVQVSDRTPVLDLEQLRSVTLDDAELMREIVAALIDDTARQLSALGEAIRSGDGVRIARLAHYCKGACANVGAQASAHLLRSLERTAASGDFPACGAQLAALSGELDRLRVEAAAL